MGTCLSKPTTQEEQAAAPKAPQAPAADPAAKPAAQQHQQQQQEAAKPPVEDGTAGGGDAEAAQQQEYAGAPAPVCELARIKHLHDLGVLYTQPEQRFDDITRLCSLVFRCPIALVSLVDTPVQWFKSAQGLGGTVDRTPRNTSFCAWTLLPAYPEALVVEDAQKDDRFKANPLVVGAPFIRFYAGCPLVCSNGMRLGSLCIIDSAPREFDANSCNLLANMAEMVVREVEKDAALREQRARQQLQSEQRQLLRAIDCFTEAIMLVEVDAASDQPWAVLFANEAWGQALGRQRPHDGQRLPFWQVFTLPPDSRPGSSGGPAADGCWVSAAARDAIRAQQNFELLLAPASGAGPPLQAQFRCAATTGLDSHMLPIGIPNFLPDQHAGGNGSGGPARAFYFATLRDAPVCGSQPNSAGGGGGGGSRPGSARAAQAGGGGGARQACGGRPQASAFSLLSGGAAQPFADIKLGPLLGKGAFGRVYRGTWQGRMVAVKIIEYTQEVGTDGPLEGLLSEQVHHPNVVVTYKHATQQMDMAPDDDDDEFGSTASTTLSDSLHPTSGGSGAAAAQQPGAASPVAFASPRPRKQLLETWLVLEFCNRGCVSDAVEKGWFRAGGQGDGGGGVGGPAAAAAAAAAGGGGGNNSGGYLPNVPALLATAREMAAALSYLHHKNMLHGDLTGNNVLLTAAPAEARGFTAKVSDFGLSRLVSADTPIIETRTYGTVTHMPPELLMYGQMSRAVDVYSWGVIVWEMASGRRPYAGMSHSQVLHAIGQGRCLELPRGIPAGLSQLLAACLSREPSQRPSFTEILDMLVDLQAQL